MHVALEQKIIKGESINTFVTNDNIYTVLALCKKNAVDHFKIFEQLDKAKCKVSLQDRLKAIFDHGDLTYSFYNYINSVDDFGEKNINTNSELALLFYKNMIRRFGIEYFINTTNFSNDYILQFLSENYQEELDWFLETYTLSHVNVSNEITGKILGCDYDNSVKLSSRLEIILRKYKNTLV